MCGSRPSVVSLRWRRSCAISNGRQSGRGTGSTVPGPPFDETMRTICDGIGGADQLGCRRAKRPNHILVHVRSRNLFARLPDADALRPGDTVSYTAHDNPDGLTDGAILQNTMNSHTRPP